MPRELNAPQPTPVPTRGPAIWDLVIEDMRARDASGAAKYGTRLQAHNGRDALVDAYQEALDLAVYLRQALEERRAPDIHEHAAVPREPAGDLTARIIALNGARPKRPTWDAALAAGLVWLVIWTSNGKRQQWIGCSPECFGLVEDDEACWAIDAQGRRIDHAQDVEQLQAKYRSSLLELRAIVGAYEREHLDDACKRVIADRDRLQAENERLQGNANSLFIARTQAHERLAEVLAENERLKAEITASEARAASLRVELQQEQEGGLATAPAHALLDEHGVGQQDQPLAERLRGLIAERDQRAAYAQELEADLAREQDRRRDAENLAEGLAWYRAACETAERALVAAGVTREVEPGQCVLAVRVGRLAAERDELARGAEILQAKIGALQMSCEMQGKLAAKAERDLYAERKAHDATRQELWFSQGRTNFLTFRLDRARRIIRAMWPLRDQIRVAHAELDGDTPRAVNGRTLGLPERCRLLVEQRKADLARMATLLEWPLVEQALIDAAMAGLLDDVPQPRTAAQCLTRLAEIASEGKASVAAIRAWLRTGPDSSPLRLAARIETGEWRAFLPGARQDAEQEVGQ